jgi:hypothetical protein
MVKFLGVCIPITHKEREMAEERRSGGASIGVFAMIMAGLVIGALCGMILGGLNQLLLAFISAILATTAALFIGRLLIDPAARPGLPPGIAAWNIVIASLIGGLAGHELSVDLRDPPISPVVGGVSGVLAAVLIASFAMTVVALRAQWAVSDRR